MKKPANYLKTFDQFLNENEANHNFTIDNVEFLHIWSTKEELKEILDQVKFAFPSAKSYATYIEEDSLADVLGDMGADSYLSDPDYIEDDNFEIFTSYSGTDTIGIIVSSDKTLIEYVCKYGGLPNK